VSWRFVSTRTRASQVAWFVLGLRRQLICLLSIWWHNTDVVPKSRILHFDVNVTVSPISWDINIDSEQILTEDSVLQIPLALSNNGMNSALKGILIGLVFRWSRYVGFGRILCEISMVSSDKWPRLYQSCQNTKDVEYTRVSGWMGFLYPWGKFIIQVLITSSSFWKHISRVLIYKLT